MRLRAPGFLLFTFAFSSALTFTETSQTTDKNDKPALRPNASNLTQTQNPRNKSDHGLEKRSAEIFPQTPAKEEEEANKQQFYESNLFPVQNPPEKRTRLGFTGMRGKKEFSADDYCARNLRARLEGALNKRFLTDYNELFGGKRASLAFHGMRGKKSEDFGNEVLEPEMLESSPQEFLINSGLLEEPDIGGVLEEKKPEGDEGASEGYSKRSPYAFQGMRGKKEYAYDLKRAMGFLGMRGKKATEVWDPEYKRMPQTSFFGMKGKKAQSNGFFGMRGKKASPNAFFGIKGKREPFDNDFKDFSLLNQMKESGSSNNRFRRGITWLNNSKKAKNAFFGIRGKKSSPERTVFSSYPLF